jgi:tetratricopeptide (TPR) repeat protein
MRRERLIYLLLLLATAAAYWPVVFCNFTNFDDWAYVTDNPYVKQGLTLAGVGFAFQSMMLGNWHPVTWLSHMLVCQCFGLNPAAHHLVNLCFHAANTLLLFHLLRRITGELWPSALVAALFALHPLHVESVAWVSERKDVLSTLFGLLAIQAYVRYAQKNSEFRIQKSEVRGVRDEVSSFKCQVSSRGISASSLQPPPHTSHLTPHNSRFWSLPDYWAAVLFFALGLMSKPMLVTWPFVLLLLDFWPLRRISSGRCQASGGKRSAPKLTTHNSQLITHNFRLPTLRRLLVEKLPFFALSLASCVVTLITQRIAGAIPDSNEVRFSMRVTNALVSYARYLGKTFWPQDLAPLYPYRHEWPDWAILGSVLLLGAVTLGVFWQFKRRPYLIMGWLWFLGTLVPVIGLVQVGGQSMADRYMYVPSIGLFVMIAWGAKEFLERQSPASRKIATAVLAAALLGCGILTAAQVRHWRDGESVFRRAIDASPNNLIAEYGLSEYLVTHGRAAEGQKHLERAAQLNPRYIPSLIRIADLWSHAGKIREAIEKYREVLSYRPETVPALNNLAWILATSEDPGIRDGLEAVRLAERACASMQYSPPSVIPSTLDTLAAAYAEAGRFKDAVKAEERARAFALATGQKDRAQRMESTLKLYRAGKPLHQTIGELGK